MGLQMNWKPLFHHQYDIDRKIGWTTMTLILNAAPNEGDGMSFGFSGVTLTYWGGSGDVTARIRQIPHRLQTDLHTMQHILPVLLFACQCFWSRYHPLIADTYVPSTRHLPKENMVLTVWWIWRNDQPITSTLPALEAANLRANIIYYLAYYVFPDHDIATLSVSTR